MPGRRSENWSREYALERSAQSTHIACARPRQTGGSTLVRKGAVRSDRAPAEMRTTCLPTWGIRICKSPTITPRMVSHRVHCRRRVRYRLTILRASALAHRRTPRFETPGKSRTLSRNSGIYPEFSDRVFTISGLMPDFAKN